MTTLLTQADEAIQIFEHSRANQVSRESSDKYPHWDDIFQKITEIWQGKYEQQIVICSDQTFAQGIMLKFRSELVKIFSKKSDYLTFKKYYSHLIDFQVDYITTQLMQMLATDDQKENKRKSLRNSKINLEKFEVKKVDPSLVDKVSKELGKLKTETDYVAHMLRAHSKQNDPNDNSSEVNDVAFELASVPSSLEDIPAYTKMFATCGQYIINLIDSETGKIMKRFNDDHVNQKNKKEIYSKLAWTLIDGKSVLVAGGKHGQIKVILPHKNVCISRFDAHSATVNVLMFHWKHPDILLSASDDCIKIWKIKIKYSEETIECECSCELINQIEYRSKDKKEKVLSLCFIPNSFLLISTELDNYKLSFTDDEMFNLNVASEIELNEDIATFLTTQPNDQKPRLVAKVLEIYNKSGSEIEKMTTNGFIYHNQTILAALVGTSSICKLDICKDSKGNICLKTIGEIDMKGHKNYKNDLDTNLTYFQSTDGVCVYQPSNNGSFYSIKFNKELTKYKLIFKITLPTNYIIKNQKENFTIPVDNYNLCDLPIVLKCASNGEYTVSTYNQNIIVIWKK